MSNTPTPSLLDRVIAVIDAFVASDTQFTMLDISNAVKVDGNTFVSHTDVRDVAKPLLNNYYAQYSVTPIQVQTKNGVVTANLYHPYGSDPSDYDDRSQTASAPVKVAPVVVTPVVAAPVAPSVPVALSHITNSRLCEVVNTRSDGKLEIPAKFFAEAGLSSEYVDIVNHPNSISIVETRNGSSRVATSGFRLSETSLKASNLNGTGQLTVCAFSDKVLITKA